MKKTTWQQKIDPAFDELIKIYKDILEQCHLPTNTGYLAPEDESFNFLELNGFPSLTGMYEALKFDQNTISELTRHGASKNFEHISSPPEDLNKQVLRLVESLPAKSRAYYLKKLEPNLSVEEGQARLKGKFKEEKQRLQNDLNMDFKTLNFHAGIIGYWDLKKSKKSIDKSRVDRLALIMNTSFQVYDRISQLTHKTPLKTLIEQASNGDDDALFKAIQIDKALFDFEWVRKRIRKAMHSGDYQFFDNLGDAIKRTPLENDIEHGEIRLVLSFFWEMGLCRLNDTELMELLKASGVRAPCNKDSFARLRRRIIRNK